MKVLIAGGSGFLGQHLISKLKSEGNKIYQLKREEGADFSKGEIHWDPSHNNIDFDAVEAVSPDVVVNLSGETLVGLWTQAKKDAIRNSRIECTRLLVQTIKKLSKPPLLFLSSSGISYYGSTPSEEDMTEDFVQKDLKEGFLTEFTLEWEREAMNASPRTRVVLLRTGLVLHSSGGVLQMMTKQFQWFMGGITGDGDQFMNWITIKDWVKAVSFLMKNHLQFSGPVNMVGPNPVRNAEFVETLSEVLRTPSFMWIPKSVLLFMDRWITAGFFTSTALAHRRVVPKKLLDAGFTFEDDKLKAALWDIYEDNGGM
eukprot:TRINITY_DN12603_c0_g1_i1.p1 TRINITY_DN12603_c0_g1~~TRINITY_DN12603_c0_g1_i1.p1  ORF type:complete len:330 (-),score=114.32 TRINITY_DN12603_c0_g1_i1:167-1108(-)